MAKTVKPHPISKAMWDNLNKKVNSLMASQESINESLKSTKELIGSNSKAIDQRFVVVEKEVSVLQDNSNTVNNSIKDISGRINAYNLRLSENTKLIAINSKQVEALLTDNNTQAGAILELEEVINSLSGDVNLLKGGNPTDNSSVYMVASQTPGVPGLHLLGMKSISDAQKLANSKNRTVFLLTGLSPQKIEEIKPEPTTDKESKE